MPFKKSYDESEPVTSPACVHLRSKAMYVMGDRHGPVHPDEEGSQHCWCNLTQHIIGPDNAQVDRRDCIAGRKCFAETK